MLLSIGLIVGALAVPGLPQDSCAAALRESVLDVVEASQAPTSFEIETRTYVVDYGCELGSSLMRHLAGTEKAGADVARDVLEFIEECADAEEEATVALDESSWSHLRITQAGQRHLEEQLAEDGSVVKTVLYADDRRAIHTAEGDKLQVGPTPEDDEPSTGAETWMWPMPVNGPWGPAFRKAEWVHPTAGTKTHLLAPLDRNGRRLDVHMTLGVADDPRPVRARGVYFGSKKTPGVVTVFGWAEDAKTPFVVDALRITPEEDSIRVEHIARTNPTFNVAEESVRLTIKKPKSVEIARSTQWNAFRRKEVLPKEWKDLVEIER